ncbi:alpha/beta hydrolase fold domain-containing protein [Mycolicibacterium setense]|uniref:alpha/beta hydrolase fold domain-containing protein n=1 Tax=Mycolicibacterium setense TaxID=431269 RepID=UPI0006897536|nr:alpha/beta hydrolase fold domain-containing protein [Mycolicibacterium setense]
MALPIPTAVLRPLLRPVARWTFAPGAWPTVRRRVDLTTRYSPIPTTVRVTPGTLAGLPTDIHTPHRASADAVLLYLHGGGFTTGSPRSHRALAARLAHACGVTTYVPDYRLAPEHPCPAAFADATAAYRALLDVGWPAHRILVAGDSAGAALTLQLAVAARDELNLPLPAALGLICPPCEYCLDSLATRTTASTDPVLTVDLMRRFIDSYSTGSTDVSSMDLPLRDLSGLPPMIIEAAGRDVLVDDARGIATRARAAKVRVLYTEHPGQGHVFHIMAGLTADANRAIDRFATQLRGELDNAAARATTPTPH